MIAEIGHALLWLAAACALLQTVAGLIPNARIGDLTVAAALANGWLWLWIALCLGSMFINGDLSVATVAAVSHARMSAIDRLAAAVLGGGGMAIVATALLGWSGAGLALAHGAGRDRLIGWCGLASLLATAWLLGGIEPFARLTPVPTHGSSLGGVDRSAAVGTVLIAAAAVAVGLSIVSWLVGRQEAARDWAWSATGVAALAALAAETWIGLAILGGAAGLAVIMSKALPWAFGSTGLAFVLVIAGSGGGMTSTGGTTAAKIAGLNFALVAREIVTGADWVGVRALVDVRQGDRLIERMAPVRRDGAGALAVADRARFGLGLAQVRLETYGLRIDWSPLGALLPAGLWLAAVGAVVGLARR